MSSKSSNKTAAELMAELQNNESYQELIQKKEKERQEVKKKLREDEEQLILDLDAMGVKVSSVWDLVNTTSNYKNAVPVLINHLSKSYPNKIKEGIIRALAVNEAKGLAGSTLLEEFYKVPIENKNLRWVIGSTMEVVISEKEIDEVIKIVKDKTNGISRQMFAIALGKVPSKKSEDVLIQVLDDDEIAPHALEALGKLKSQKAKSKISELTKHPKPLIKKEAIKALKKIG